MQEDFITKLEEYTKAISDAYLKSTVRGSDGLLVTYTKGKKYYRVVKESYGVHSFVDFEGNIWKPAGWAKPTLNFKRGNIFNNPDCVIR